MTFFQTIGLCFITFVGAGGTFMLFYFAAIGVSQYMRDAKRGQEMREPERVIRPS